MTTRIEHDLLGERALPADAWYGIQSQRALENFRITGIPISHFPELVQALAMVKSAAARANQELGMLEPRKAEAIQAACADIQAGALHDHFVVDLIQGGAGTSTNMNANEVIANLALAKLGHPKGAYQHLHPNDDVNRSQSTNDAYPTAACLSLQFAAEPLIAAIGVVTALVPHIGYANATRIARQALHSGATVRELVIAEGLLDPARVDALLSPQAMLAPTAGA